jgi:hypothetical protein
MKLLRLINSVFCVGYIDAASFERREETDSKRPTLALYPRRRARHKRWANKNGESLIFHGLSSRVR